MGFAHQIQLTTAIAAAKATENYLRRGRSRMELPQRTISFAELRLHREALILFPVVSPSVVPREKAAWFDDDRDPVWFFLRVLEPPLPLLSPILCRYLPQELPLVLLHDPGFPFDDDRPVRPLVRGDAYGNTAILGHCLSFHA